jgi:hypothetical protein
MIQSFTQYLDEALLLQYHDQLNPEVWDQDGQLIPIVKDKLLQIARQFMSFSNISESKSIDIILTGSNSNFNYIPNISDLDVHIIVDPTNILGTADRDLVDDYLFDKKTLWANRHAMIRVKGYPVELFFQSLDEYKDYIKQNNYNRGVYSMTSDQWLAKPTYNRPNFDDPHFLKKLHHAMVRIDNMMAREQYDKLHAFKKRLLAMRGEGLKASGEFADSNLIYKELRAQGYLDKVNKYLLAHQDKEWSLD